MEKIGLTSSCKNITALYEVIITTLPGIVYILDSEGTIQLINPSVSKLGYTPRELIGKPFLDFISPSDKDSAEKILKERQPNLENILNGIDGNSESSQTLNILTKDNKIETVRVKSKAIVLTPPNRGKEAFTLGIAEIITEQQKTQNKLEHNVTVLQGLLNSSADGILVVSPDDIPIHYNDRFLEMWDIPKYQTHSDTKMLQIAFDKVKDPDTFRNRVKYLYNHPDEKSEDEIDLKDGRTYHRHSHPLIDKLGKYHGRVWQFHDITIEKEVEKSLADENIFLDAIIESLPGDFFMYEITDSGWEFVKWNANHNMATGYSDEESLGQSPEVFIHKEDYPKLADAMEKVLRDGNVTLEARTLHKDGYTTPYLYSAALIKNKGNTYVVGLGIDISDRKQNETMLNAVFNSPFHLCGILDAEGRIIRANKTALNLIDDNENELKGKYFWDTAWWTHSQPSQERIKSYVERCARGEMIVDNEVIHIDRNGHPHNIEFNISPLYDNEGKVVQMIPIGKDVTERRRLMQQEEQLQLRILNESKLAEFGRLATGISHNLNNPLGVILGNAQLLKSDCSSCNKEGMYFAGQIIDAVGQMCEIIQNLMYVSRQEQNKSMQGINLNELIRNHLELHKADSFYKHQLRIRTFYDPNLPIIEGIYSDFSQAFGNLVQNAAQAMWDQDLKNLTIKTWHDKKTVYISVNDTGCGIPEDSQNRIFESFYTTKPIKGSERDGEPTGTGLGLSSAQLLLSKYNARINFESKPGDTTFTINIPVE